MRQIRAESNQNKPPFIWLRKYKNPAGISGINKKRSKALSTKIVETDRRTEIPKAFKPKLFPATVLRLRGRIKPAVLAIMLR
jgi:hypothetical protein